jgi:3'(2'), 5'-bisphosphate nucleotidase
MKVLDRSLKETRVALECVKQACQLARRIEQQLVSSASALEKEDRSPVTVADFAVQALIARELSISFPEVPLVAEESSQELTRPKGKSVLQLTAEYLSQYHPGVDEDDVRCWIERGQGRPGDRFWVLDPVDGTKGFLRGGQYAVALALVVNKEVRIGVLGCPHLAPGDDDSKEVATSSEGSVFVAVRGQGSWACRLGDEELFPIRVSGCIEPSEAVVLRSYESSHTNVEQMTKLMSFLDVKEEPIRLDSLAKYALLALGKGDLLFRLISPGARHYHEKIWDQAAGMLVVEEAGGRITDLDGRRLDFSTGRLLEKNRGILASNGSLHEIALTAVRETGA